MTKEIRRSMPLLSMKMVMQLTTLSARQIRYYEEHQLITPERTTGNQRMFSLNDVDTLLEIKDLIEDGMNMASVKQIFTLREETISKEISDSELRRIMREERMQSSRMRRTDLRRSDLSRFY